MTTMTIKFSRLRSPQVEQAVRERAVLILPIGQTEEHGPHLPVCTDTYIAEQVCGAAVRRLRGRGRPMYVLDPITYGYSQRVLERWPGTFIIEQKTVFDTITAVGRSVAAMGFRKLVLASLHGNHDGVVRMAARRLLDACGLGPGVVFPAAFVGELVRNAGRAGAAGSCHAGEMETALMLHLAPHLVDMSAAIIPEPITNACPFPSSQAFVSTWSRQVSRSGVYGDPTKANAFFGRKLFEVMVEKTSEFLLYYAETPQPGCSREPGSE